MAKLHNTPIKTLRYYDEIGLFKPIEVDEKNGYRYYSTEQFEKLNTINYLKVLGISLKEIKSLLEIGNTEFFIKQLTRQKEITINKIKELEAIRRVIEGRISEVVEASCIKEFVEPIIKHIPERKIYRLMEQFSSKEELEIYLRKLENNLNRSSTIFIGKVGLTVSKDNLCKNIYQEYNSIFILQEGNIVESELSVTLSEGEYAQIYYRGDHTQSSRYYNILLEHILESGYKVVGDSIERTIINEYISQNNQDYLTEIQIPVKKI
jgi:effector-binding domain-containing protein